jgi:hypothetical protein
LATSASDSKAEFTDAEFGKRSETLGSRTTTFELFCSRSMYFPRTNTPKSERLYSERRSSAASLLAFFIELPFSPRRFAATDDSDGIASLGMRNDEESPGGGHAKGYETPLTDRMIRVVTGGGERIKEHARSFFERDSVFPEVLSGLLGVPLKAHTPILHLGVFRRITVAFSGGAHAPPRRRPPQRVVRPLVT